MYIWGESGEEIFICMSRDDTSRMPLEGKNGISHMATRFLHQPWPNFNNF